MDNQRTPFYENAEPISSRRVNDLREKIVYKNISQMVREEGDGSEDVVSFRCQNETNSNLTQEMEGDLYSKADREENAAKLLYSSCEGWVYVNSDHNKKPLSKGVYFTRPAGRDCDETQSITENNNKKSVVFFDLQSQRKEENKASISHSEFLSGSENQKLKAKGKINLGQMPELHHLPENVEIPAELNTENKSHSESKLNNDNGSNDNQIERDISCINVADVTLENESIYIDMDNESSIDDAYVDMYPIFPTVDIPSDSKILKEEIVSCKGSAFHVDMAEDKASSSKFNSLKPIKEILDCSSHACNINEKGLPNKPQPAPRTLPKNTEQVFQTKPCPVPMARSDRSQSYSHNSKSVVRDGSVNEACQDLHDTKHTHNLTSRDIKLPADTVSQSSESSDENQAVSTTINVENVKPSLPRTHLLQEQYKRGNYLETFESRGHSVTFTQDEDENLPPSSAKSFRNSTKTSSGLNSSADHAKEEEEEILPRALNSNNQEYDAYSNDDSGNHSMQKQHLPISIHQVGGQKLTPHSAEGGQGLILETPTPLLHKDDRNQYLNRSLDNLSSSVSSPPLLPFKKRQTSIIKQSHLDEDKNDIPPKLVPRKSRQSGKSRTTPPSSQLRDYGKNPDDKALEDTSKPPRPPKTYLQQGNGASNIQPHTSYNYGNQSTFSETRMESTFPSTSSATGKLCCDY